MATTRRLHSCRWLRRSSLARVVCNRLEKDEDLLKPFSIITGHGPSRPKYLNLYSLSVAEPLHESLKLPCNPAINEDSGLEDDLIGVLAIVFQELTWPRSLPGVNGHAERLAWSNRRNEGRDGRDED